MLQKAFLALFLLVLIWYTADAAMKWWVYESLTAKTEVTQVRFQVQEESSDRYFMKGSYEFSVEGKEYGGEELLKSPMIRNELVAKERIREFEAKPWMVWYAPSNPAHSSLQKSYPFKECLYATVLWGILIYFLWLYYTKRT